MLCLFQLPVQFRSLSKTRQHRIQWGDRLQGFCCDDNKIYCVEERWKDRNITYCLTLYDMSGSEDGSLTLLDKVELGSRNWHGNPCVDSSHRVYVLCGRSGGRVLHCLNSRLLSARDPLKCVRNARSVCGNTSDTVFMFDADTNTVCLVNLSSDTVIRRLELPGPILVDVKYECHVSVLGQRLLVCYSGTLMTYLLDSLTPGQVLQRPKELMWVSGITTDSHSSSFLITDYHSVFVLDDKRIRHRIYKGDGGLRGCAVVQSQL